MASHQSFSPEFKQALQLFVKSPQSILIRHIFGRMVEDEDYMLHNEPQIMRVIKDVLRVQGFNPDIALSGTETSRLINEAAIKLKITTRSQCRTLF